MAGKTQKTAGQYIGGRWVPYTEGRDLDQDLLDKEKFQDTSALVAASKAPKKPSEKAPLTGLAKAAHDEAERRKRKARSQAEAIE